MQPIDLEKMTHSEVIAMYPKILSELRRRNIIRTKNLIGELGEYLAIHTYNSSPALPKLTSSSVSTQNVDANSNRGARYSIKSVSGTTTGAFHSSAINGPEALVASFEFLLVVVFSRDYAPTAIYEFTWEQFVNLRRLKKPENKWVLPITKQVLSSGKRINIAL